jgi:hypothetical protein
MAHNTRIKPQAADTMGLTALFSRIGVDIGGCRVVATHFNYQWGSRELTFDAAYLMNNAAADAYIADNNSVNPIRMDTYNVGDVDLDKSLVDQCLDHLLTLQQFNGSQGGATLAWVKT